jgi:hypothetical protein
MSDTTAHDVAATIPRNIVIGIAIMFVITVGIALLAGLNVGVACGVAALPAFFAGPFVGGLITMIGYQRAEGHDGDS